MKFASKLVIKTQLRGLRIVEVPTPLRRDRRTRLPHLRPWSRRLSLEYGLIAGAGMVVLGLTLAAWTFWHWRDHAFGDVDPSFMMRCVISTVTLIALGCQLALTSFFSAVLDSGSRTHGTFS